MFILISLTVISVCIVVLFLRSQVKAENDQRHLDSLHLLRQIIQLCRAHRTLTHQVLTEGNQASHATLKSLFKLKEQIKSLAAQAKKISENSNKAKYRVLLINLTLMCKEWRTHSVNRKQVSHGKVIRQCLYLMDESIVTWMIEAYRDDMTDQYHHDWQLICEAMECLTQLRVCIQGIETEAGKRRYLHYGHLIQRRLNQISLSCAVPVSSDVQLKLSDVLSDLAEESNNNESTDTDNLYKLTNGISVFLFGAYDYVISSICEELYEPLPEVLPLNHFNTRHSQTSL
ncbi:hypothetical protein Q8W40_01945 [Vibrio penaeicida]|uniref:hypothetical protein n=1 Tax=Vibrio penaeicida TaxID=104609 RepID=UPI002733502E|nr:hypothetical protein [Vibrio penaeicida]MDP2570927.1 hypothetical protein [Vibrio penaeicida]